MSRYDLREINKFFNIKIAVVQYYSIIFISTYVVILVVYLSCCRKYTTANHFNYGRKEEGIVGEKLIHSPFFPTKFHIIIPVISKGDLCATQPNTCACFYVTWKNIGHSAARRGEHYYTVKFLLVDF